MRKKILKISNLHKTFYGFRALNGVSMNVNEGELLGIMGPNGSGKSTLLNCITGIFPNTDGKVFFRDKDITGWNSSSIFKIGIARTFQMVQIFPDMCVLDNILGALQESKGNMLQRLFQVNENKEKEKAMGMLDFLKISHLKNENAKNLSYGQQKLLDLGMALIADPSLILLDEPLAGVNLTLGKEIIEFILKLVKQKSCTVIIIEHNAKIMLDICSRIIILNEGKKLAEGKPEEIKSNKEVIKAYFGA